MRKILWAGVLAVAAVALVPERSYAWGRDPYNSHGYGWLGSMAFRFKFFKHQEGPLFNYGPYNTQGLVTMHIPQPYHGSYTPANQALWNSTNYGIPNPYGYPGAYPGAYPGYAQPGMYGPGMGYQPGPAAPPRVLPANYYGR